MPAWHNTLLLHLVLLLKQQDISYSPNTLEYNPQALLNWIQWKVSRNIVYFSSTHSLVHWIHKRTNHTRHIPSYPPTYFSLSSSKHGVGHWYFLFVNWVDGWCWYGATKALRMSFMYHLVENWGMLRCRWFHIHDHLKISRFGDMHCKFFLILSSITIHVGCLQFVTCDILMVVIIYNWSWYKVT